MALPLLLLVGLPLPDVVVVNLTVSALVRTVVVDRFRQEVDRVRAGGLVLAAVPGIMLGTVVLRVVPVRVLEVAAGVATLLAVAALTASGRGAAARPATRGTVALAGGLGGPSGPRRASTLSSLTSRGAGSSMTPMCATLIIRERAG